MSESTERLSSALAGRYQILSRLGEGGMATVYLAEDLKHKRQVAVKVLKPELAAVLGAERFVQEITTTANLQHPHILPLFDSGEADSFLYYVMPYIEGETLRSKLDRETQLGIDEAVKITTEVADALDYAHRKGVIHRDIKPENILLHDGRPMVADFGIALAVSAAAGGRMTETGLSLGTPHYMSPEQATAEKNLNNRSDIYSLGSVLYEMLAGDPPHTGSSAQQIVMKIIAGDVAPLTSLRKSVPSNVAAAVTKSLEKLPADRFETAKAFAEALGNPGFTLSAVPASALAGGGRMWNRLSVATAVLAALFLGTTLWGWLRGAPGPAPSVTRTTITPTQTDGSVQPYRNPALSRDGTKLVYAVVEGDQAARGLYLRALDRFDAVRIPGTEGGRAPFFSPDGEWIGFWADGAIRKVPVRGGPVVVVAQTEVLASAVWGPDDRIVFSGALTRLHQVSASGGPVETLTALDFDGNTDVGHYAGAILPQANAVLFTSVTVASVGVAVASMDTGEWHILIEGAVGAGYLPTGHILFGRPGGSLWAVAFDPERLEIRGEPVLAMDQAVAWANVAENGTMVFGPSRQRIQGELTWVDHTGAGTSLGFPPRQYLHPRVSPDGRHAAVTIREPGPGRDAIWILDLERHTRTRFTEEGTGNRWPVWTHAGARIAFATDREGAAFDLFWKPVDGSTQAQALLTGQTLRVPFSWSEDHQTLAYYEFRDSRGHIRTLSAEGESVSVTSSTADERAPNFSPDGRWLAYVSNESGEDQVYVKPYPALGAAMPVSIDGGIAPVWSRAGDALYFRREDRMMVVDVSADGRFGSPRELFRQAYALSPIGRGNPNYDVWDDRFLMVRSLEADGGQAPIHVVLNFFEELKARMAN
jgi:serine/threonine-protein kinase